ncbi:putative holin [Serratia oryzae]|uniref:putative holin n=1 Tax=Serratia oryzae TaxID=2034155 RepID=UPI0012E11570|nr:putative holin [Serratia oryzae]
MAEPVTTTTTVAGGAVTGVAIVTFFAGLPADVVLGAFAGAILFVASASEYGIRSRLILALGSFIAGITMYKPAAALVIVALPATYDRGADAAGALLAAGCVLGVLMGINKRNAKKKGGDDADNS